MQLWILRKPVNMPSSTNNVISVVIPVYNAEKFLAKSVISALNQKEVGEIVLVEDGSPDNSIDVCIELAQKYDKVKLFRHDNGANKGAGASRNLGIKNSTLQYIAFLDADDYYCDERFRLDLKILNSDPSVDGVYNALGLEVYDASEAERVNFSLTTTKEHIPPEDLFENMSPIGNKGYFHIDTLTVRKTAFEKIGLFNTSLELSQDTELFIRMSLVLKLVGGVIDKPVGVRGVHANNRIKNEAKMLKFRPLVFKSLVQWGIRKHIGKPQLAILWSEWFKYYSICLQQNETGRLAMVLRKFLFVTASIKYPFLLTQKKFYQQLPLCRRFVK